MGVYNNNKDGTRSIIANTIQVVDAPMEQFVSRGEFNAVVPSDTSADNKLMNSDTVDTKLNDIWKVQGELGAKNFIKYPYYNGVSKTENGITFTENDGAITINGTPTGNAQYFFAPTNIPVLSYLPKGKYIMSVDDAIPSNIFVQFLASDLTLVQLTKDTATEQSFEITSDTIGNIQLKIIIVGDKTFDNVVIRPMIRLASDTDTTYQPYAKTNKELTDEINTLNDSLGTKVNDIWKMQGQLSVKNLIPFPYDELSLVRNGITWVVNDDGSITANGTATNYSNIDLHASENIKSQRFIPTQNEYVATAQNADWGAVAMSVGIWDVNKRGYVWDIGFANTPTKITFTNEEIELIENDAYRVVVKAFINKGRTANNVTVYPMLRLASDTDDTWQPYAPTNYQLNQKLATIPSGKSAYQIAVDNGYSGTEADWLASLKGEKGADGTSYDDAEIKAEINDINKFISDGHTNYEYGLTLGFYDANGRWNNSSKHASVRDLLSFPSGLTLYFSSTVSGATPNIKEYSSDGTRIRNISGNPAILTNTDASNRYSFDLLKNSGYEEAPTSGYLMQSVPNYFAEINTDMKQTETRLSALENHSVYTYDASTSTLTLTNYHTKYVIKRVVDQSINLDSWRLYAGYVKINDQWSNMWLGSDAEGPIKIDNESDFISGFHGDEILQDFTIYKDNAIFDTSINSEGLLDSLVLYQTSTVYRADSQKAAFTRYKKVSFQGDNYSVQQRWVALVSCKITESALVLLQCYKTNIVGWDADTLIPLQSKDSGNVELDNGTKRGNIILNGGEMVSIIAEKGSNDFEADLADYTDQNRIKFYFRMFKGESLNVGDVLNSKFSVLLNNYV